MTKSAENENSVVISVRVTARASKSEIVGLYSDVIKVRIAAPPVDGAANSEIIKLFAKTFGVAKSKVEIVSGSTSKTKRLRINGVTPPQVAAILKEKS